MPDSDVLCDLRSFTEVHGIENLMPAHSDILRALAKLKLKGSEFPAKDDDVRRVSHQLINLITYGEDEALTKDGVSAGEEEIPDVFWMDSLDDGYKPPCKGEMVPAERAFAQCKGVMDWKRVGSDEERTWRAVRYARRMLDACAWRDEAVVVVFDLLAVEVYKARRSLGGPSGLYMECWKNIATCVTKVDKDGRRLISEIRAFGLGALSMGMSDMQSVRIWPYNLKAMQAREDVDGYAASGGVEAWVLGVGSSAWVCALRVPGREDLVCLKTVRIVRSSEYHAEKAALNTIPNRPSFPKLLASGSWSLFTTPVVEPLLNSSDKVASRLGFAAYAPLVEDLGVMHKKKKAVFHFDVAPHNLGRRSVDGVDCAFLMDFGSAAIVDNKAHADNEVPYRGATWFASTGALEQLVRQGDHFGGNVTANAAIDLESLAKSIAVVELPAVTKRFEQDVSYSVEQGRKVLRLAACPSDIAKFWRELPDQVPELHALDAVFDAARGGNHGEMARLLRAL